MIYYFEFKFYCQVSKRLLHFHITILDLNYSQRRLVLIFIVELCFNLMITHPISVAQKRLLIMMFPMHQVLMMIKFTCVVGSLSWKSGMSVITNVQMTYGPTDKLLKFETAFCDICHKNCLSPADFVLHQECVHLCLPLFACPVCYFTYITCSCLQMHITESHGGPETAISCL